MVLTVLIGTGGSTGDTRIHGDVMVVRLRGLESRTIMRELCLEGDLYLASVVLS